MNPRKAKRVWSGGKRLWFLLIMLSMRLCENVRKARSPTKMRRRDWSGGKGLWFLLSMRLCENIRKTRSPTLKEPSLRPPTLLNYCCGKERHSSLYHGIFNTFVLLTSIETPLPPRIPLHRPDSIPKNGGSGSHCPTQPRSLNLLNPVEMTGVVLQAKSRKPPA